MRKTNILEKVFPAIINVVAVVLISQIFLPLTTDSLSDRAVYVIVFFVYNLVFLFLEGGRDLGMMIFDTHWAKEYKPINKFIYAALSAASFATLLFKIWFPLDLFLINMLVLQLPSVIKTGKTLNGLLAGGIVTVTKD
jgi:hypothetical protein